MKLFEGGILEWDSSGIIDYWDFMDSKYSVMKTKSGHYNLEADGVDIYLDSLPHIERCVMAIENITACDYYCCGDEDFGMIWMQEPDKEPWSEVCPKCNGLGYKPNQV